MSNCSLYLTDTKGQPYRRSRGCFGRKSRRDEKLDTPDSTQEAYTMR